jgi:hypothetical protein
MVPSAFVFGGSNALANIDATPNSQALLSQIPYNARVAIYDEDNLTVPSLSVAENLTNNIAEITTLLEGAGHFVDALSTSDILNHKLITADYDVFILVNNLPKESISKLVKEFWLGGGGLLTFNGALSYLWYEGIFVPGVSGDPRGLFWEYFPSDSQNVSSRHPTMKDYHINETVYERAENWAVMWGPSLEGFDNSYDYTVLMNNLTQPDYVTGFARESFTEGGRLVHLPGDGSSIPTDFESIIIDSVEWLIPKPKGRIAFDLSHSPRLSVDQWDFPEFATLYDPTNNFAQFRTLAANHSYTFDKLYPSPSGNLTAERLAAYDVLVLDYPDSDYTSAERAVVDSWVNGGGSLLILGDRTGIGGDGVTYLNQILQNFDMSLGTTDVLNFATMTPGTHVTLEGCSSLSLGYRNYLSVIGNATTIWLDGTDPVVAGEEYGEGRAILSSDQNIFDNGQLGQLNNERFALNVLNWLTAASAEILVFDDYLGGAGAIAHALNDLGLSHQMFVDSTYLDDFLDSKEWKLVIFNAVYYVLATTVLDELYAYADDGGKLIMTYWFVNNNPTHPLWSKLGVEYSSSLSGTPSMYIWEASHPIFTEPNDHGAHNYTSIVLFADDGDAVTIRPGYTALAGTTVDVQDGNAAIVVSNDKQTLFNGFVIDNFGTDEDDSTYEDRIELWQNEIVFMMGTGGAPFPIDPLTLALIGGIVVFIIVIGVLFSRRRGGGSAPAKKPAKKTTKKK